MAPIRRVFYLSVLAILGLASTARAQTPDALRAAQIQVAEGQYAAAAKSLEAVGLDALSRQGAQFFYL